MGRGERLAESKRKKAKMRRVIRDTWFQSMGVSLDKNDKFVGKMAATPHPCSGMCCGNPRRHYKGEGRLTMQEKREKFRDSVMERCDGW